MEDQREQQEQKFQEMTQAPVGRLVGRLAFPCIISMLVTAFYNMADTFFVGMMDSNAATGAVGVVFSMMAIIHAVGSFFGHGSGNFISRELGKHNLEEASNMAATGFFSALAAGALICLAGQIFLSQLASLLGATPTILPYANAYLRVILLGAPWMTASLVLNNQLRFQGSAAYAMVGITSGAVLNIGLDPLLIFVFDMGVAGAAWATIISQFVSFCLLLVGCTRGGNLKIHISRVQLKWPYYSMIIRGGLPSLARQGLASVATICLNHAAGPFGDAAIAAMSVVQRITTFGASAMIGFGQGFQPVCGFNYGAKKYGRVKEGFKKVTIINVLITMAISAFPLLMPETLMQIFISSAETSVIEYGVIYLSTLFFFFFLNALMYSMSSFFRGVGDMNVALAMSMISLGVRISVAYALAKPLGYLTISLSQPISWVCALALAFWAYRSGRWMRFSVTKTGQEAAAE